MVLSFASSGAGHCSEGIAMWLSLSVMCPLDSSTLTLNPLVEPQVRARWSFGCLENYSESPVSPWKWEVHFCADFRPRAQVSYQVYFLPFTWFATSLTAMAPIAVSAVAIDRDMADS